MKCIQIHVHVEYTAAMQAILERHGVLDIACYPQMQGRDREGRRHGTRVFPGNLAILQALVADEKLDRVFADLEHFRGQGRAHAHLQAFMTPVERVLVEPPQHKDS